ncbi:unnamed protein product [Calypogeia fissa]
MAMERHGEPYKGGMYGGGNYGGNYGGGYQEGYQMKRFKSAKSKVWDMGIQDPEVQRKKRVASYKVYTVEGKLKASVRRSLRWIKNKYIDIRYGWC